MRGFDHAAILIPSFYGLRWERRAERLPVPDMASVLTHKNGCGGAISIKERSFAVPISKVDRHISYKYCSIVCVVCTPIPPVAEVSKYG